MTRQPHVEGVSHETISANGIKIHVARAGQGQPLVLLHGWPEFWYVWHKLVPLLSDRYELIMPDLRGFGATEKPYDGPSDQNTPQVMARDLAALGDALGFDRFGVVSHDVGAMVAQAFALMHRQRLSGLFFFNCPYPGIGPRWMAPDHVREIWYQTFHQQSWSADLVGTSRDTCRTYFSHFLRHWSHDDHAFDADLEHFVDNFMVPGNIQGGFNYYISIARLRLAIARGEAQPIPPIDVPTYVLWGRHDPVLKAEWSDNISANFTDATVEIAEHAGHFVHYEAPELAAERIAALFSAPGE
ncbi:MAG: alpha/beta hydrolase [Alphaproteobacteria bacterium]|nr:alpha/beta hydrolase [Alphaproteobacteria bacterium]